MKSSLAIAVVLGFVLVISGCLPAFAAAPSVSVSYNPAAASKYHAPLSDMGVLAVTHYLQGSGSVIGAPQPLQPSASSQSVPVGLTRFINDTSYMPQSETSIAVDSASPTHVVGGFNDARYFFCPVLHAADCPSGYTDSVTGFTTSTDGGVSVAKSNDLPGISVTEKNLTSGVSAKGFLLSWGDPSVAAAPGGNFYFSSLAIDPNTGANGIMVAVSNSNLWNPSSSCSTLLASPSQNTCWTAHLIYSNLTYQCLGPNNCGTTSFEDKDTIAVDTNPSSPDYGNAYVAWDHFYTNGTSASFLALCTPSLSCTMISGGGASVVSGSDRYAGFSTPVVGASGTVYMSWCDFGTAATLGPIFCEVRSSPAGGQSWGAVHSIMSFMGAGTTLPGDSAIQGFATEQFRASSEFTIAAGSGGALYFAIPVCVAGSYYQIEGTGFLPVDNPGNCGTSAVFFTSSADGGADWSNPTQVSQQAVVIQPTLATDPSNGAVVLSYYTTQYDPFNHRIDVELAVSQDQGQTFSSFRVTPASNEPNADPSQFDYFATFGGSFDVPQYGDYFTVTALNGRALVLFTANYAQEMGTFQTDPFLAVVGETPASLTLGANAKDAAPGDSVSYGATGLTPGSAFSLTMNWGGVPVSLADGTVPQSGAVHGNFTVPNVQSQQYTVVAKDSSGLTASGSLGVGQVSLTGVQSAISSLGVTVNSLGAQLNGMTNAIGNGFSSLNSSLQGMFGSLSDNLTASVAGLDSKVTSTLNSNSSTLTIIEYLLVIVAVLVVVSIALQFRRRDGTPKPQPTPAPQVQPPPPPSAQPPPPPPAQPGSA